MVNRNTQYYTASGHLYRFEPTTAAEERWDEGVGWTDVSPTLMGWMVEGRHDLDDLAPKEARTKFPEAEVV